jgi:hypothetical protein
MSDVSGIPHTHTASDQWQSFEVRMRERRIQRLMQRAEAALEAQERDGAEQLIEEIEQLDPKVNGIAELRARLHDATTVRPPAAILEFDSPDPRLTPVVPAQQTKRKRWMASVAASLLLSATAGWLVASREIGRFVPTAAPATAVDPPPVRVDIQQVVPTESTEAAEQSGPASSEAETSDDSASPAAADEPPVDVATPPSTRMASIAEPPAVVPAAIAQPSPIAEMTPVVPAVATGTGATGRTEETPAVVPTLASAPIERLERAAMPDAGSALRASGNALPNTSPASSSRPPDDAGVRSVLARYQSAYSQLDADAARAVWPALDRRALARAFEGLASQRVDLGACDVRVMGEMAQAECVGSATWTPKVGGGSHSQRRRWEFRLRNSASSWQIVSASVR